MKRTLITAMVAGLMLVAATTPTLAVVGVAKPENPDMMVITSIKEEEGTVNDRMTPPPGEEIIQVKDVPEGDLMWYSVPQDMPRYAVQGYVVQKGDTLWTIVSKSLNTTNAGEIARGVAAVTELNNLENPNLILVGQSLTITHEVQ